MQEDTGHVIPDSNLASDIFSTTNAAVKDSGGEVERDLMALMNNSRCPEGLKKALWQRIVAIRKEKGRE